MRDFAMNLPLACEAGSRHSPGGASLALRRRRGTEGVSSMGASEVRLLWRGTMGEEYGSDSVRTIRFEGGLPGLPPGFKKVPFLGP